MKQTFYTFVIATFLMISTATIGSTVNIYGTSTGYVLTIDKKKVATLTLTIDQTNPTLRASTSVVEYFTSHFLPSDKDLDKVEGFVKAHSNDNKNETMWTVDAKDGPLYVRGWKGGVTNGHPIKAHLQMTLHIHGRQFTVATKEFLENKQKILANIAAFKGFLARKNNTYNQTIEAIKLSIEKDQKCTNCFNYPIS